MPFGNPCLQLYLFAQVKSTCLQLYLYAQVNMAAMLDNLLLPCVNTARKGDAEKASCYDTVAAAGAGAELLTSSTVGTCSGRHRVILVCYLVTVTACAMY